MKSYLIRALAVLLLACTPLVFAENEPQQTEPAFTQEELDQMLAPIALYPDKLLSQVLMAATYPLELVQAARWSRANPELKGAQAVKAAEQENWDPSVISLTAFPQILAMMDEKLDWTERLGDAFLDQQPQVMDTVQRLRQKAMAAGNLHSNDQIRVSQQGPTIIIDEAAPQIVYVPYYDPTVVYGPWWWDAYPPVYWQPWPGYYRSPGYDAFYWGSGVVVGSSFFFSNFDWPRRHLHFAPNRFHDDHMHDGRQRFHQRDFNSPQSRQDIRQRDPGHRGLSNPAPVAGQQFGWPHMAPQPTEGPLKPSPIVRQPLNSAITPPPARVAPLNVAPQQSQPGFTNQDIRSRVRGRDAIRSGNTNLTPAQPSAPAGAPMVRVRPEDRNVETRAFPTPRANPLNTPHMPQAQGLSHPGSGPNAINSISRGSAINPPINSPNQRLGIGQQQRSMGNHPNGNVGHH